MQDFVKAFEVVRLRRTHAILNQDRLDMFLDALLATETDRVVIRIEFSSKRELGNIEVPIRLLDPFASCSVHKVRSLDRTHRE